MKCPYCNYKETRVLDTRENERGDIRRRRECPKCKRRFTTYETAGRLKWVIKKDGKKEEFEKEKIINGIKHACEKRPVKKEDIEKIADEIELELMNKTKTTTKEIGKRVLSKLKKIDNVCYIRFASVHNEFNDMESFENEIEKITRRKKK